MSRQGRQTRERSAHALAVAMCGSPTRPVDPPNWAAKTRGLNGTLAPQVPPGADSPIRRLRSESPRNPPSRSGSARSLTTSAVAETHVAAPSPYPVLDDAFYSSVKLADNRAFAQRLDCVGRLAVTAARASPLRRAFETKRRTVGGTASTGNLARHCGAGFREDCGG